MMSTYGSVFSFFPESFLLPTEYTKFVNEYTKCRAATVNKQSSKSKYYT
jgi:hypothetical protein